MHDQLASACATIARTEILLVEARDIRASVCCLRREVLDAVTVSRKTIQEARELSAAMDQSVKLYPHGPLSFLNQFEVPDRGSDPRGSVARW